MTFLYRHALFVSRKQPYIDWANSLEEGESSLNETLARRERTVYLANEIDGEPSVDDLLPDYWEGIFEEELAAWHEGEEGWPMLRTREMFDAWFDVELCSTVQDMDPDQPLTEQEVIAQALDRAVHTCASCGIEIDEGAGRYAAFKVADPTRLAPFKGLALPLPIEHDSFIAAIVPPADSEDFGPDEEVVVRVCSSGCEKAVRKIVPKALRRFFARMPDQA